MAQNFTNDGREEPGMGNRGLRSLRKLIRQDLAATVLIATLALGLGVIANQFRDVPLPLVYRSKSERLQDSVAKIAEGGIGNVSEQQMSPVSPESVVQNLPPRLSLAEFREFVEKRQGIVADARPEIFHRLGHVPGAISLPRDDFETFYRRQQAFFQENRDLPIVIYCSGGSCEDSDLVQAALEKLGHSRIAVFVGGWNEWTAAGLPEETAE